MPKDFNFDLKEYPEVRISKLLSLGKLSDKDLREKANKRLFCKLEVTFIEQSYLISKVGTVAGPMAENGNNDAWSDFKQVVNNLYAGREARVATLQLVNQLSDYFDT